MVKMETTEPSVMLKLKKGGHVSGHAAMKSTMPMEMADGKFAAPGKAPKKPSIMERRKSMKAPMLMSKKGGDVSQDKAMIAKAMKQHDAQEHKGGKGTKLKLKNGGTTKVVDGDKHDSAHGTGEVKMGKPAGYATGGSIPSESSSGSFKTTKVYQAKKDGASGTGGVKMSNAGGFKNGGEVNWENRPADTAKPGKTNTTTGGVKEGNGGGYKKGGAAKKHFATGGAVDTGRAVAMPRKPVSQPVANSLQSGTFKKGGKVARKADGGGMPMADDGYDPMIEREARRRMMEEETTRRENEATPVLDSVKKLLGMGPKAGAGRGFVNPPMAARKTGGRAKR
jgi:hypothetical protein